MVYCCSICLDDYDELPFTCLTRNCQYGMCHGCVKVAFEDSSGQNSRFCPSCKAPAARRMVESICGKGAVQQVEQELRKRVEFEVQKTAFDREKGKQEMGEMKDRARKLFLRLSERLNMKCPRCNMVFDDYDGCNALTCSNPECKAAICAICLQDCGRDAHDHVQSAHGNLFDKPQFKQAKQAREDRTVRLFLDEIKDEPFEVRQLVKIESEKSSGAFAANARRSALGAEKFLRSAKENLASAVKADRLSVLGEADGISRNGIQHRDISPRCAIPTDFKLTLSSKSFRSRVCQIKVQQFTEGYGWREIALPDEGDTTTQLGTGPKIDVLMNIRRSLQCGIIAFEGARSLCQTKKVMSEEKQSDVSQNYISIVFTAVNGTGGIVDDNEATLDEIGHSDCKILGINQNLRLVLLERHVKEKDEDILLFGSLRNFVGFGTPSRVFSEIPVPAPTTFENLNEEQKRVAHPLTLTSAMEAAGPPGTGIEKTVKLLCLCRNFVSDLLLFLDCIGKTKTITELVRGIIQCTDYEVIVLSERNGAIEAIAEKIAGDCLAFNGLKEGPTVTDVSLWMNVLAFGSAGGMGESTKHFTMEQKKR